MMMRNIVYALSLISLLALGGCKAQQQMQQQITEMDGKLADAQKKITTLESELKKEASDMTQLKGVIAKMGDVVVNLQKTEDDRQKKAAEAAAKAAQAAEMAAKKKAGPKGLPSKKKH